MAAIVLAIPMFAHEVAASAARSSRKLPVCVASQIKTSGRWTFSYPKKGTVGGRVGAQATVELMNTSSRACTFARKWPKVRLLDRAEQMLPVHEQEIAGEDVAGTPILPARGTHSGQVISLQWINWCGPKPALPIHILYRIVPTRTLLVLTPRVRRGHHFHVPGCINPEARSVIQVAPYLAFTAEATK